MDIKNLKKHYRYKEIRETIEKQPIKSFGDIRTLAEAYYKDLDLHKKNSFPKAIKLLEDIKSKEKEDDNPSETLCLLGAIYKRKWEYEKDLNYLFKAIGNYEKAYIKKDKEWYYGAINTSFLYEILANEFKNKDLEYTKSLQNKANDIRNIIINEFDNKEINRRDDILWIKHTLAQAYLGIGDLKKCREKLEEANEIENNDWENHTTYKHLKLLSDLKNINDLSFLDILSSNSKHIVFDKKGLALSGGGFRASFFHLGTLAKLAELNILKDIEVISTVSGGSIIGVLYYLKLQKLLEEKFDKEITKENYIELVNDLINEFYNIVQTGIRNSVITEKIFSNTLLKIMNPFCSYSRSNKLGELYQKRFYDKYKKTMSDLIITPKDWEHKIEKFKPRFNNWNRINKVPIIVINATNLNSGHSWQFQASKMGEPEYMDDMEIDKNDRFNWVRYNEKGLQKEFKNYSIGEAVACSSAVPILFTPIVLKDLYKDYKLSISDGGVYDNQGFSGLLSEECDYIICSDASGQMDNQILSHTTIIKTNIRTIDIQMDKNRELMFENIQQKFEKGILKGFLFTHFKQNIRLSEIKRKNKIDSYNNEFYELMAKMRTDLDIFSELEVNSLMYCGYKFLEEALSQKTDKNNEIEEKWKFLSIEKYFDKDLKRKFFQELELSSGKSINKYTKKIKKWWYCI